MAKADEKFDGMDTDRSAADQHIQLVDIVSRLAVKPRPHSSINRA
jgi:hypothetical protein